VLHRVQLGYGQAGAMQAIDTASQDGAVYGLELNGGEATASAGSVRSTG
jgi:hypothetical protein